MLSNARPVVSCDLIKTQSSFRFNIAIYLSHSQRQILLKCFSSSLEINHNHLLLKMSALKKTFYLCVFWIMCMCKALYLANKKKVQPFQNKTNNQLWPETVEKEQNTTYGDGYPASGVKPVNENQNLPLDNWISNDNSDKNNHIYRLISTHKQ